MFYDILFFMNIANCVICGKIIKISKIIKITIKIT